MALNDPQWNDGTVVLYDSSGPTVGPAWNNGTLYLIHNYWMSAISVMMAFYLRMRGN